MKCRLASAMYLFVMIVLAMFQGCREKQTSREVRGAVQSEICQYLHEVKLLCYPEEKKCKVIRIEAPELYRGSEIYRVYLSYPSKWSPRGWVLARTRSGRLLNLSATSFTDFNLHARENAVHIQSAAQAIHYAEFYVVTIRAYEEGGTRIIHSAYDVDYIRKDDYLGRVAAIHGVTENMMRDRIDKAMAPYEGVIGPPRVTAIKNGFRVDLFSWWKHTSIVMRNRLLFGEDGRIRSFDMKPVIRVSYTKITEP